MKKRWVKALIAAVVVLAAVWLTILGSAVRSRSKVQEYKDQLRAAGEKLRIEELIPPRLESASNSAGTVREAMNRLVYSGDVVNTNPPLAMHLIEPGKAVIGWQQPEVGDGNAANTWEELGQALAARADGLDLLRTLPGRAQFDFELDYRLGPNLQLPQRVSRQRSLVQTLGAAVQYDLHQGDSLSAATNLHAMLALSHGLSRDPILITQLVRIAMAAIAFNAQWEWLQASNATEADLALLQHAWSGMDFVRPMESALTMERAMVSMSFANLRGSNAPPEQFTLLVGSGTAGSGGWLDDLKEATAGVRRRIAFSLWRGTWSQTDELNQLKGIQVVIETARQIQTNGSFAEALAEQERRLKALGLDKPDDNWLRDKLDAKMRNLMGSPGIFSSTLNRVLRMEISRQLAVTAIAVKRHTLRHGAPPADLESLVPEFLPAVPRDPVDGLPLRYRRNTDGSFTLYSVGADGVDNGGDPAPDPPARTRDPGRGRDYVWPQPATAEEIQGWEEREAARR